MYTYILRSRYSGYQTNNSDLGGGKSFGDGKSCSYGPGTTSRDGPGYACVSTSRDVYSGRNGSSVSVNVSARTHEGTHMAGVGLSFHGGRKQ